MRLPVRLIPVLLLLVVAAFAVSYTGSAQTGDDTCGTEYDFDGNGRLTKADMYEWFELVRADGCLYSEVSDGNCAEYDVNGNQYVDDTDLEGPHAAMMACGFRTVNDLNSVEN